MMKKIAALDCGDVWTGSALSDVMHMLARPYKTVSSKDITSLITTLITQERIGTLVIGYPQTMRGTESAQTKKVVTLFEILKEQFPTITCILWDERLTSKHAAGIKKGITKEDKVQSHSIAAALILTSYLDHLRFEEEFGQKE
jgi:putative holliday junction resolvase